MPWTRDQIRNFFTEQRQMAIPVDTVNGGLMTEGITNVMDLEEFNDEDIKSVQENLRKPAGTIVDPDDENERIARPSYVLGAKSVKRLKIAASAVRYYMTVGREITAENMHFQNVLKNFGEQWDAIIQKGKMDEPDVPKITRALPIVRWTESFEDFLHQVQGSRHIALAYLIREDAVPRDPAPPLLNHRCYSAEHKSVMGELIARANHDHTMYTDDNQKLYSFLEEATRTTQYASSIRPFSRSKDGREAYLSIKRQYAGKDKWQAEIKKQENFIHTRVWKGNSNFTLESFITQHRAAHVSLQRCAQAVPHQIPNERTRVIHLTDAIQCSDAPLQAAIAHIKSQSDDPGGMANNFEEAAAYLLQFCPVSKKRKTTSSERNYNVSSVTPLDSDGQTNKKKKPNKGKTGVELRYYKPNEYRKLAPAQIEELREWRKEKGLVKNKSKNSNVRDQVVAAIKEISKEKEDKSNDDAILRDFIVSMVKEGQNSHDGGNDHRPAANNNSVNGNNKSSKSVQFDTPTINAIIKRLR